MLCRISGVSSWGLRGRSRCEICVVVGFSLGIEGVHCQRRFSRPFHAHVTSFKCASSTRPYSRSSCCRPPHSNSGLKALDG